MHRAAPFPAPPVVVGHRGAPLLEPENTVASFRAAWEAGATWVELDVRRAGDGAVVVHHDPVRPDGRALVDRSVRELAAEGVCTLREVLAELPRGLGVDIEVKNVPGDPDYDDGQTLVAALPPLLEGQDRPLALTSFDPMAVLAAAEALPEVPLGLVFAGGWSLGDAVAVADELPLALLCPAVTTPGLDAGSVRAAHDAGLQVMVWTVDDLPTTRRLVQAGVDAVCTNDPGGVVAALRRG